jgi:hypothetical protein
VIQVSSSLTPLAVALTVALAWLQPRAADAADAPSKVAGTVEGRIGARPESRGEDKPAARRDSASDDDARGEGARRDRPAKRNREPASSDDAIEQLSTRIARTARTCGWRRRPAVRRSSRELAPAKPRDAGLGNEASPPAGGRAAPAPAPSRPIRTALNSAAGLDEVARTAALANGQPVPSLPLPREGGGAAAVVPREPASPSGPVISAAALAAAHRRAAAAATGPAAAAPLQEHRHWSYAGESGPESWGQLDAANAKCANGNRQSPIDIRDGLQVDMTPITFDYRPVGFRVIDTGHTIQVDVARGNAITVMGRRYELQQFHFHKPSEERVAGRLFDMVAQLASARMPRVDWPWWRC